MESQPESFQERREKLKETFGIAFSTNQKEGGTMSLENQTQLAREINLSSVQFDFRNRADDELMASSSALIAYRQEHLNAIVSIHGETPKIDEQTLDFKNKGRIEGELQLLQELSGESYTVHPPSISSRLMKEVSADVKEKIIANYVKMFVENIKKALEHGKQFTLGIENMPMKGEEGAWGQNVEDILFLIQKVEDALVAEGFDPQIARSCVGATLDVNHALHGVETTEYRSMLESWFKGLGEYLKVVHLYTPSQVSLEFTEKYKASLDLASQYNPNARLYMESKQNSDATGQAYATAKLID